MSTALAEYEKLVSKFASQADVSVSQMFGKVCLKVNGKAFVAQHKEAVVFKLAGAEHEKALALKGSVLWDPSGKGRPMKAWVAVPAEHCAHYAGLCKAAMLEVAANA